MQWCRKTFVW